MLSCYTVHVLYVAFANRDVIGNVLMSYANYVLGHSQLVLSNTTVQQWNNR